MSVQRQRWWRLGDGVATMCGRGGEEIRRELASKVLKKEEKVKNRWRRWWIEKVERIGRNRSTKIKNWVIRVLGLAMTSQRLTLGRFGDKESEKWIMGKKGKWKGGFGGKFDSNKRKENLPFYGKTWMTRGSMDLLELSTIVARMTKISQLKCRGIRTWYL